MSHARPRGIAALFAVCALLAAACATARSTADVRAPAGDAGFEPSIEAVYARLAGAMSRPGEVYAPTIHALDLQGDLSFSTVTNAWIEVGEARARGEVAATFAPDNTKRTSWLISDRAYFQTLEYDPTFKREATTCRGSDDPLLAIVLGCRGEGERGITTTYAPYQYKGHDTVALVTAGTLDGPGQRAVFTDTLFLDAATYLPIALEGGGRVETLGADGSVVAAHGTGRYVRYDNAFVTPDTLAEGWADPATIGYTDGDPVRAVSKPLPDFTTWWLGPEVALDGLPPLTIRDGMLASATDRPALRYRATITYRPLTDEFAPTTLHLQEWRLDEWKAVERLVLGGMLRDPCLQTREMEGEGRRATIYGVGAPVMEGGACGAAPTAHAAAIWLGQTVVFVTADSGSPFNRENALRAVVGALRPAN